MRISESPRNSQKFHFIPGGLKICVTTIQQFVWMLGSCWRLICVVWESPPVFVTAQSLCVVTERRDTAVNNSFDNGSAPFKCYNGPNIFSKCGLILFWVFFFFFACSDNKQRGRGTGSSRVCRRLAVMHQWQYSINPSYCIRIFGLLLFFFRALNRWRTADSVCLLYFVGNSNHSVFKTKGTKDTCHFIQLMALRVFHRNGVCDSCDT